MAVKSRPSSQRLAPFLRLAYSAPALQESTVAELRRFTLPATKALPFVKLSSSQWEMVVAVRNLFHEDLTDSSVYDELQVIRPPKHVLGGVTVHF